MSKEEKALKSIVEILNEFNEKKIEIKEEQFGDHFRLEFHSFIVKESRDNARDRAYKIALDRVREEAFFNNHVDILRWKR